MRINLFALPTLCSIISVLPAHAQITFTKVADTTTTAPTGIFSSFGVPSLSGGTAAFRAVMNGNYA